MDINENNEIKAVVVMNYLNSPSPYSTNVYSTEVVQKAIDDYNAKECKFGTLGDTNFYNGTIPMDKISHKVTNMWIEDNTWYANIAVLNTPYGGILKQLIKGEAPIRFSSRGVGTIGTDGVVTDYALAEVAAVADPSIPSELCINEEAINE